MIVNLILDGFSAQTKLSLKILCDQVGTMLKKLDHANPWANRSELNIRLLKESVRKCMIESNSHMVLWDYTIELCAFINNAVPRPLF